jgi:branched-chain amino acid transport system permease protein
MPNAKFVTAACVIGILIAGLSLLMTNDYYIFAAYFVLQYVVVATAWNILGGYAGYVNFGTTAFLAIGLYSAAALDKWLSLPIPVLIVIAGLI